MKGEVRSKKSLTEPTLLKMSDRAEEPVSGSQAVVCRNQLHCALYCTRALTNSGSLLQPEAAVLTLSVRVAPAE